MPVSGFKVHMLWRLETLAISEDYYWNKVDDDPKGTIYPKAKNLMAARTLMMGQGVVPIRFRISKAGAFRNYIPSDPKDIAGMPTGPFLLKVSLNAAQTAAGISDNMDGSADDAPAAILMDFWDNIGTHGHKFLSGVPDVMIRTNPSGPWVVGVPTWNDLFKAYLVVLQDPASKWTFKARTVPPAPPATDRFGVLSVTFDQALNAWGVELPNAAVPFFGVGRMLQLGGFKMLSRAYVPFQGTYQVGGLLPVASGASTFFFLRGTANLAGTQILNLGYARQIGFDLFPFTNVQLGAQTERKRGNRQLASPGRRRTPARVSA